MIDIRNFKKKNPGQNRVASFTEHELSQLKGKLPDEIVEFLQQEGKSVYNDGFLWTVLPDGFHETMSDWGFDGSKCFVFMYSSFGSLLFFYKKNFYVLNSLTGKMYDMDSEADYMFNYKLSSDITLRVGFWRDLHKEKRSQLPDLKEGEMYALVPAIPLGGSPETSKIEVVGMKEHLAMLAELYDHKVID